MTDTGRSQDARRRAHHGRASRLAKEAQRDEQRQAERDKAEQQRKADVQKANERRMEAARKQFEQRRDERRRAALESAATCRN